MKNQLKKVNYIPVIIALIFNALIFLLLLLPHSQYSLLNEMTALNDQSSSTINWLTILPAIFTIFVILFSCINFVFALLALFMDRFYNYHFVNKILFILIILTSIFEYCYFFIGINGVFDDGSKVISYGNIITIILYTLYLIAYIYTYILFIEIPYKKIMEEVKTTLSKKTNIKSETKIPENIIATETVNDMQKMILDMLEKGKISSEEANKLLNELNNKKD